MLKKIFAAALLFFIVLICSTWGIKNWRFYDDDYGAVYLATTTQWADLGEFFSTRDNDHTILPSNELEKYQQNAATTAYRPLTLLWYFFVCKIIDPYKNENNFFLLSMLLHALLALILFFVFQNFLQQSLAFLAALVFCLWPYGGMPIGRFVLQSYTLGMILVSLSYLCLKRYFTSGNRFLYLIGLFLLSLSIFFHEAFLSFLPIFACGVLIHGGKEYKKSLSLAVPFVAVLVAYFLLKKSLFASESVTFSFALQNLLHKMSYRFYDFVTLIFDACGYSLASWAGFSKFYKVIFLVFDILGGALFLLAFVRNRSLLPLIFLAFFLLQSWPSFLVMHVSRYLYFSLPFLLVAVLLVYQQTRDRVLRLIMKLFLILKLSIILYFGTIVAINHRNHWQKVLKENNDKIKQIADESLKNNNENVLVFGLEFERFPVSGLAQALWFYSKNKKFRVFNDQMNHLRGVGEAKDLKIERIDQSTIALRIKKESEFFIRMTDPFEQQLGYGLGNVKVQDSSDSLNYIFTINKEFDFKRILTWDFNKNEFMFL